MEELKFPFTTKDGRKNRVMSDNHKKKIQNSWTPERRAQQSKWMRSVGKANKSGKTFTAVQRMRNEKLKIIHEKLGKICPGCLHNFQKCDDYTLIMIFQVAHVHAKKCRRIHKNSELFLICATCNTKQGGKCGRYVNGVFVPVIHV